MSVEAKNWMSAFPATTSLYDLLLPGTHDSGTEGFGSGTLSRTQFYKVNEQLNFGVRFLDMRISGDFHVVHGTDIASFLEFETVVKWSADFLAANPSETVLMSIKQEGIDPYRNEADFAKQLEQWNTDHVRAGDWKGDLWYTAIGNLPTLDVAKGHIVLFKRYDITGGVGPCLFFGGIDLTTINGSQQGSVQLDNGCVVRFQDEYKSGIDAKKKYVSDMLQDMQNNTGSGNSGRTLYINFTSTTDPNPKGASDSINPWVTSYFAGPQRRHFGVILNDFAEPNDWEKIYRNNFR